MPPHPHTPEEIEPRPRHEGRSRLLLLGLLLTIALAGSGIATRYMPGLPLASTLAALPLVGRYVVTSASAAQAGSAVRDETVRSLETLRARYGDPLDATYGRMRIPALHVDAPIGQRMVGKDGQLADPTGASDIVWYDFAGFAGLGGTPGGGGNAVFAGHVDRAAFLAYANVQYSGPGIFYSLDQLTGGEVIEVAVGGKTTRYAVQWVREVSAATADWRDLLSARVGGDAITLITCGGTFDRATHEYSHRTVVRALRV